jgi:hypothetical protein
MLDNIELVTVAESPVVTSAPDTLGIVNVVLEVRFDAG